MANIDLELVGTENFDLAIAENGDFRTVENLNTAIDLSILTDARADESEVINPLRRRGWFGNVLSEVEGHEQGCKIWLVEQAKFTPDILSIIEDYAKQGLDWIERDEIGKIKSVVCEKVSETRARLSIQLEAQGEVYSRYYDLWSNTINAN